MPHESSKRVVATGLGLVSSLGHSREEVAANLRAGQTGFVSSPHLPHVVCPVAGLGNDACLARLNAWRHRRYLSRAGMMAVLAGLRALEDAGLSGDGPAVDEVSDAQDSLSGTDIVATAAPMLDFDREPGLEDESLLDALWILRWLPNTPVSALARICGIHGEGKTVNAACASSLAALGEAFARLREGVSRRVLVVASDSRLSKGALLGYARAKVLSTNLEPDRASRPFDEARDGFVPGEGGAAFLLETLEEARKRGARILFEILGYGASMDGESLTAPRADGKFALEAAQRAFRHAGLLPRDVAFVSAHGTGTRLNDEAEAKELSALFGDAACMPPITALKSWIGHGASACGALELAVAASALGRGFLPRVRNLEHPAFPLPFVRGQMSLEDPDLARGAGLVQNFGFGGHNAVLLVRMGEPQ